MKLNFMSTRFLRILVAAGYLLMCLLAGGIMYLWHYEWKEIEALETENQRINNFRQEIHHVYGEMTGLSLLGESVLEWEDEDLELSSDQLSSFPSSFALKSETEEKERIIRALEQAKGKRNLAAKLLGIGRTTLYKKMKEYGITPSEAFT